MRRFRWLLWLSSSAVVAGVILLYSPSTLKALQAPTASGGEGSPMPSAPPTTGGETGGLKPSASPTTGGGGAGSPKPSGGIPPTFVPPNPKSNF